MFETFTWLHMIPLLKGAIVTLTICAKSLFFGMIIGLIFGIMLTAKNKIVQALANFYTSIIRGIPLLVILFMIFYAIPLMFKGKLVSRELASLMGLTVYSGAYIAVLVKGAIQSINVGQDEAARALGMSTIKRFQIVILPQAFRFLLPPLVGFIIGLIKESSLVSIIGYIDLSKAGKIIGNLTLNPLLVFSIVALIYFSICFPLSKLSAYAEKKLNLGREKG